MNIDSTLDDLDDYDWMSAFSQVGESETNVSEIIASSRGENDEEDWLMLYLSKSGRYCKLSAGCDYTGWDCQAWGVHEEYNTLEELLSPNTLLEDEAKRLGIRWNPAMPKEEPTE